MLYYPFFYQCVRVLSWADKQLIRWFNLPGRSTFSKATLTVSMETRQKKNEAVSYTLMKLQFTWCLLLSTAFFPPFPFILNYTLNITFVDFYFHFVLQERTKFYIFDPNYDGSDNFAVYMIVLFVDCYYYYIRENAQGFLQQAHNPRLII